MDLVSLYVDQIRTDDLSRERAERFPDENLSDHCRSLTLGGSKLAVDGVVMVGEHGNYPKNEKGQTQYPRYEFFEEIVEVFRRAAAPCRCSTTSTSRGIGTGPRRCTTHRGAWAFRSWRAPACR